MEETGCEVICCASTASEVKGQVKVKEGDPPPPPVLMMLLFCGPLGDRTEECANSGKSVLYHLKTMRENDFAGKPLLKQPK